ncbi:uncharacterized protein BX664DRAFT_296778 [Halteromyces radiatus]|uniref:uncharacterized protein n=1 Tax=Halteromyces radiatus TaxID=101107 RepID=UPI00221EF5C7|nr:uncharacterized protein BX664DRAFT_296778 [Halteromyces radiatus]KAI8089214.1 hypothetical protein BX664DRAFT_296778 [Halteromyces radiatus]
MSPHIDSHILSNSTWKDDDIFTWEQVCYYVTKYGTIENYLLTTKLKFPPSSSESSESPSVIILPNDFPYSVEKGIDHILVWSQVPLKPDYVEHVLQNNYDQTKWEWVYFVNPPEIQSVKKLPHVHVFLRRRPFVH